VQRLGEQRVRAQVLGQHDRPGGPGDRGLQGRIGPRVRPGQQRHDHGERWPRAVRRDGQGLIQAALVALQVGDLDVRALAGLRGRLGDLHADLIAGGAGAAGHGDHQRRRVRGQGQPVRAAMAACPPGPAGAARQRLAVRRRSVPSLRERLPALGQRLTALRERVPLGEWFAPPGQWVPLGERLAPPGQWVPLGQRLAPPGERVPLGQRLPALRERLSLGQGLAAARQWLPLRKRLPAARQRLRARRCVPSLRQGLFAPGQGFAALRQWLPPGQRFRCLAGVSHVAVWYSGFIRHDRCSRMFSPETAVIGCLRESGGGQL